jgi:hypothetical protein
VARGRRQILPRRYAEHQVASQRPPRGESFVARADQERDRSLRGRDERVVVPKLPEDPVLVHQRAEPGGGGRRSVLKVVLTEWRAIDPFLLASARTSNADGLVGTIDQHLVVDSTLVRLGARSADTNSRCHSSTILAISRQRRTFGSPCKGTGEHVRNQPAEEPQNPLWRETLRSVSAAHLP